MMQKETGSREFPIWLLGDSNPANWEKVLEIPLDPRHPARHSIWTPILEVIQDKVYRYARLRVDTSSLYIRNAIECPGIKPQGTEILWSDLVLKDLHEFQSLVNQFRPIFVFSFGAFAYEFARRSMRETPDFPYEHWGARSLGADFRMRVDQFSVGKTNIFSLLHATIARGRFIQSHEQYVKDQKGANYFEYVGNEISELFLANQESLHIWIR